MELSKRKLLFILFLTLIAGSIALILLYFTWYLDKYIPGLDINLQNQQTIQIQILLVVFLILTGFVVNEAYHWVKRGKRGDSADIVILGFLFVTVFFLTDDILNAIIGAFSIYLIFGIVELKEYEVLNKILMITVITYNFVFIAGIIDVIALRFNGVTLNFRDTAFSFSIWIMLILGFMMFGRKYIVVFRFLSPQYLTMFLFVIAWLAVRYISQSVEIPNLIYLFMIITNWFVYLISGPILDLLLGVKRIESTDIIEMVEDVKKSIGLKGKIKIGYGKYPILNALAYGSIFDKRIAIIAEDINSFPRDELKGIIAHELNHVKGKHTLILSLVSTIEILVFMLLKWPVTYYDYVFNPEGQPFGMFEFILINLFISVFIYVFIRVLEAKADINTKKAGLGNELAKGLYNLEGFYSSSREMGLDTMLLCDEKLLDYNRINNYSTTAEYLNDNMVYPGRLTLLSNLINSHPPSFHRIIAMYGDLNPWREAILPISLMSKNKRRKFSIEYEDSIVKYKKMANSKFIEMFGITDFADYMNKLNKRELYENAIGKMYLYLDKLNMRIGAGYLTDVQFNNDVCNPVSYLFYPIKFYSPDERFFDSIDSKNSDDAQQFYSKDVKIQISDENIATILRKNSFKLDEIKKESSLIVLNPLNVKLIHIEIGAEYFTRKNEIFKLLGLKLPNIDEIFEKMELKGDYSKRFKAFKEILKNETHYIFKDSNNELFSKSIKDYKIGFNLNTIRNTVGKEIFLKENGTIEILNFKEYRETANVLDNSINCKMNDTTENEEEQTREYKLDNVIIKKDDFSLVIHNDEISRPFEKKIFDFLIQNKIRTTIYLKKPINNQETGYLKELHLDQDDIKNDSTIKIENIQGEMKEFPVQKIEVILFSKETISLENKKDMSLSEKIIQKIIKWRKPHIIFDT
jgi:Zn-dependent protease with chaperone function